MQKQNKKILAINKPISELTESEVDEVIKELIKNHVEVCRKNIPWSGENDRVIKKIMKLFRETS